MQVDGVIRKPVTGAPIDSGRRLYHGLAGTYRIVLATEATDRQHLSGWLGMEGFTKHDHVVYGDEPVSTTRDWWPSIARALRGRYGYDTDLFVVPDPEAATHLIQAGFNALLFVQAAYALPEWRPDTHRGARPWKQLVAEVATQRLLRADDNRMENDLR
jgi:hypothetical protein